MHRFHVSTQIKRYSSVLSFIAILACSHAHGDIKTNFKNIEAVDSHEPITSSPDDLVVRDIYVDNQNIFNPTRPKESGFIFRLANALHIKTKVHIIEKYLLFKRGDIFSERLLDESERLLRKTRNLQDALISYKVDGQLVDVYVATQDTWSLKPKVDYSHKGGVNKSELGIEEDNLLGLGIRTSISHLSDGERTSKILKINDDNLTGRWHALGLVYADSSDGSQKSLSFAQPFYALDTRNTYGFIYDNLDEEDIVYDYGKEQNKYRAQTQANDFFWGWSEGLTSKGVVRHSVGLINEDNRYDALLNYVPPSDIPPIDNPATPLIPLDLEEIYLPQNYHSFYPYYSLDFLQNKYKKVTNFERIGKTEDLYLGHKAGVQVGYGKESWGNDQERGYFEAYAEKAMLISAYNLVFFNADIKGRYALKNNAAVGETPNDGFQNLITSASIRYYQTQNEHFKGYVDFYNWSTLRADKRDGLYMDPETGLRGYPLYYLSGTHLQKMSIEERFYSNIYFLQIFKLGAAVFYDIGHITGNINAEKDGIYQDVGLGLRLSNNRSSKGDVIHIDFSYPLDIEEEERGWKLSIESKKSF